MERDQTEDVGEEEDDSEEFLVAAEVIDEVEEHMKMVLSFHMSPSTLKMKSGLNYKTKQEKFLITLCATSSQKKQRTTRSANAKKDNDNLDHRQYLHWGSRNNPT